MTIFCMLAVFAASASVVVYGEAIWDPTALVARFGNPIVIIISLFDASTRSSPPGVVSSCVTTCVGRASDIESRSANPGPQ